MRNFAGSPRIGPSGSPTPPRPGPGSGMPGSLIPKKKAFDVSDFKQYFHIIVKRIWLVTLCFIVAVAVAVVMLIRQQPFYRSTAHLQVSRATSIPGFESAATSSMMRGSDYWEIQRSIILSPTLQQRAVERMGIPGAELRALIKRVTVSPAPRTARIQVSVESLQSVVGSQFANMLAEEYIEYKTEQRLDDSQNNVINLTQQANRLRDELARSEQEIQAYRQANNMVAVEGQSSVSKNHLTRLNGMAADMRTQRLLLQAQQPYLADASDDLILRALTGSGDIASIAAASGATSTNRNAAASGPESLFEREIVSGASWNKLKRDRAKLQARMASLQTKYKDSHPAMLSALREMDGLNTEINVELQFALDEYQAKLQTLELKERAIRQVATEWEMLAREISEKEERLRILQKHTNRLQNMYELVFNRLKEIEISIGNDPEVIQLMERAVPAAAPVSSRPVQIIFLAGLMGIGIGVVVIFGLEYIDDSIRYPEEVIETLQLTFFGVIPSANWDPEDLNSHLLSNIDQKSGLAEAYRNVRSAMIFSGNMPKGSTLAVTSAVPREGKTTTSLNMSVSFAQAGSRVLLVDADMRRGELHKFFGLEGGRGLSDILSGNAKPESLIQRTGMPNLDLVSTGPFPTNPGELLLRPEFRMFSDQVKRSYDYVVFDCPPIMAVSESAVMASLADSTIFVVWAGQTSRKLSQMSVQLLRERGANIIGCVLNNLEFGRVGYYYYSTYYGYYDYDYRYEKRA